MGWRFLAVVIILSAAVLFLLLYFSGFIFPESITNGQQQLPPQVVTVVIPENASLANSDRTFEPKLIKVVIGANNTVRWINNDNVPHWIEADNDKDSDFFMATTFGASSIGERRSYLVPGASFGYTFTKLGEFGYHGQPWMRGTVVVLS